MAALGLVSQGNLSGAIAILRPLAETSDDPEDRFVLGIMAFLATHWEEAQAQLEHAFRDFRARGLPRRAAIAATWLGVHFDMLDDKVVARAWLARASRLLEPEGPCVEQGYVLVGLFGVTVASADELEVNARSALDLARRFQDLNLECKALADWGLALVSMGDIRDGMTRLDEAFTMIVGGECRDPAVISQAVCGMINACDRCGDLARAEAWLRFVEKRVPVSGEGPSIHTFAQCWRALGSVLSQVGRWREAETVMRMALARGESSYHFAKLATRASLADLWLRQGRLADAARLLDEDADRVEVMGPRARLYLAQGRHDLAAAMARQALRQLAGDRLRSAPLLLLVVEAELGRGDIAAAQQAAMELEGMSQAAEVPAVDAQAALALGKIATERGEREEAARRYESGLAALGQGWPLLRAALCLELARIHQREAPAEAIVNAEAALSIYQRLGAPEAAAAAELLQALGRPVSVAPPLPTPLDVLSRREREVLALLPQGLSNPAIANQLFITPKTVEHHVSSILSKLGLKNRAEAAAFAASFRLKHEADAAR